MPFKGSRTLDNNFSALLGIKVIKETPFLVVVAESYPCCTLPGELIYEVKKIDWIPIVPADQIEETLEACDDEF